ncbi:urease accessory protein UreE [Chitinophaga nivalis]|uniref:Urease accessory protein UreE n=1 Tax=Chitinophaga nivalis TaxID=2991709 RepID=A0ABT3IEW2_9BACT|nr:urease accessory protein UreE [Chitinophaga nivalis]MCW3467815.1 urease accessory protein UreE [Chitinophaga nivalis]MCW3482493.1 urease accessory protein UreE [Chitinophaga nivalis]
MAPGTDMLHIEKVVSNPFSLTGKEKDVLDIEWYETEKHLLRRSTRSGKEVAIRKNNRIPLEDGDVIWMDDSAYICINILPCECIVIRPANMYEMGVVCFEIGNRHIPVCIEENRVSVAYEGALFTLLERGGFTPEIVEKKLLKPLRLLSRAMFKG